MPEWFLHLLDKVIAVPYVKHKGLPAQTEPFWRPAGGWCFTEPIVGVTPLLFSFPQPLHPLEALAAWEGFGGCAHDRDSILSLATRRALPFASYSAILGEYLALRPWQVRQAVHWFTPLTAVNIPPWLPGSVPGGPPIDLEEFHADS